MMGYKMIMQIWFKSNIIALWEGGGATPEYVTADASFLHIKKMTEYFFCIK